MSHDQRPAHPHFFLMETLTASQWRDFAFSDLYTVILPPTDHSRLRRLVAEIVHEQLDSNGRRF